MASITLKNVPEDLRLTFKARAAEHGRSLNQEIIQCLRVAATLQPRQNLEAERAVVQSHLRQQEAEGFWTTPEEIEAFIDEGHA
ncbi:MAG TPA: Arc family DNA-binding protein [Terriglobales bacterium]|nr:Arc family DNA-binding protein [Terriglobales bacterium]